MIEREVSKKDKTIVLIIYYVKLNYFKTLSWNKDMTQHKS